MAALDPPVQPALCSLKFVFGRWHSGEYFNFLCFTSEAEVLNKPAHETVIVDPQCRLSFDQTSHCCTVITFHKPQTKKNLSLLYANSKKCKFKTF